MNATDEDIKAIDKVKTRNKSYWQMEIASEVKKAKRGNAADAGKRTNGHATAR